MQMSIYVVVVFYAFLCLVSRKLFQHSQVKWVEIKVVEDGSIKYVEFMILSINSVFLKPEKYPLQINK